MKTNFKTIAIVSLGLIVFNLNAQDFAASQAPAQNHHEIALAMTTGWTSNESSFSAIKTFEPETEKPMELKNWMTNEGNFAVGINVKPEAEKPLQLEPWMTDEAKFSGHVLIENEMDEPMRLESWMTDVEVFNRSANLLRVEKDKNLEIKDWMFNSNLFQ